MPAALTLFTRDHRWRIEIEAQHLNLELLQSIGTHVSVFHKTRTTSIWGSLGETDWDLAPADFIHINNIYRSVGFEAVVREKEWRGVAEADLEQRSLGHTLHLPVGQFPRDQLCGPIDIAELESLVTVIIGDETITGIVCASCAQAQKFASAAAA